MCDDFIYIIIIDINLGEYALRAKKGNYSSILYYPISLIG